MIDLGGPCLFDRQWCSECGDALVVPVSVAMAKFNLDWTRPLVPFRVTRQCSKVNAPWLVVMSNVLKKVLDLLGKALICVFSMCGLDGYRLMERFRK